MPPMQVIKAATYYTTWNPHITSALALSIDARGEVPQRTQSNPSQASILGHPSNQSIIFGVFGTVIAAFGLGLTSCILYIMYKERQRNAGGETVATHELITIENDRDVIANDDSVSPHSEHGSYLEAMLGEEHEGNNREVFVKDV